MKVCSIVIHLIAAWPGTL